MAEHPQNGGAYHHETSPPRILAALLLLLFLFLFLFLLHASVAFQIDFGRLPGGFWNQFWVPSGRSFAEELGLGSGLEPKIDEFIN